MADDDAELQKLIERAQEPRSKRSTRILRGVLLVLVGVLIGVVLGRVSASPEFANATGWSGVPETSRTMTA